MKKRIDCVEYLSVDAPLEKVNMLEDKQRKYIREFVRNKRYVIVKSVRRNGVSPMEANRQWDNIMKLLRKGQVQAIVVSNMQAIARDLPDAYRKIGQVVETGGMIITVDEGELSMNIKGEWK